MCCTLRPADLSKTVLYAGEAERERNLVHVLGYQNRARNRFNGPNAMILPFPAAKSMGPRNCLETTGLKWMMNDLAATVHIERLMRSASRDAFGSLKLGSAKAVTVFDSGEYTVVLAEDARDVPHALNRVPEEKRPEINEEIFDAYAKWYPDWPIAMCCWASRREMEPEPLLWWFEPKQQDVLWAPALDSHNGKAPNLSEHVRVDHAVLFGSTLTSRGAPVRFRREVPQHIMPFVSERVVGEEFQSVLTNGDFAIPTARLTSLSESDTGARVKINRVLPPGASRAGSSTLDLA
jgi:hypothetical protein